MWHQECIAVAIRTKAHERAATTMNHRRAEWRDETGWKLDCSLGSAGYRTAQTEVHRTAVACENYVGIRQCTSISPPALQFHYREMFNREIHFVHTRMRVLTFVHNIYSGAYKSRQNENVFHYITNKCFFSRIIYV